jgi:carboxypeptidase PM20D1
VWRRAAQTEAQAVSHRRLVIVRKILPVWIPLALLALVAVLLGRTLMVAPPAPAAPAASAEDAFEQDAIAQRLAQAVRFRTISWQEGAAQADVEASRQALVSFRDWIAATYPAFSAQASREIVSDYSLLYTWKGSDPSLAPYLLMSHMDVVPVAPGSEPDWTHPPFAGDIAEGYVWGRGTIDTKAGIIGQLEAAEALAREGFRPKRTVMFAFGHDEETGGQGNTRIAAMLAERGVRLEFVDDEGGVIATGAVPGIEGPVAVVGVAEKGYLTLQLTAHSPGGHSSLPLPIAQTAIGRLAHALGNIERAPFVGKIDGVSREFLQQLMPYMSFGQRLAIANLWLLEPVVVTSMSAAPASAAILRTTIAPTMVQGGVKENVLPPSATLTINFRVHPRDTTQSVLDHIRQAVNPRRFDSSSAGRSASGPWSRNCRKAKN